MSINLQVNPKIGHEQNFQEKKIIMCVTGDILTKKL